MSDLSNGLSISRYIDAPPSVVWQIITERLPEWWCPVPWRTEVDTIEWRAGGAFNTTMYGPAGEVHVNEGIFLDVQPGRWFVCTDAIKPGWHPQKAFMIGIFTIEAEGSGTRYTASARHWSAEDMERHRQMGFVEGWSAVADQLAELAEAG
jgi:uncharacterized protein YndB with AHSA1/START domain